jgi:hypothetical protein
LEFAQTEVGDCRGIAPKPTSTRPRTRVIVSTEGEAAFTLDEIPGNSTELAGNMPPSGGSGNESPHESGAGSEGGLA